MKFNQRFRDLIPPLSAEELRLLEESIARDGCRDPLVTWRGTLIDGHNRHEICLRHKLPFAVKSMEFADEDLACIWIIRNQFGRRNLTTFARAELALKLEPLIAEKAKAKEHERKTTLPKSAKSFAAPVNTRAETAKAAGVSGDTIAKTKLILEHASEETKQRLRTEPDMKVHRVAKEIKETKAKEARQAKRVEAAKDAPASDERIIVGDFREHADKVADGSLSLIFTDPTYDLKPDAQADLFDSLGKFAAAKLAEGGSLVFYVGQTKLLIAGDALRVHLRYWWTAACVHAGGSTWMKEIGVHACWKPILWFVKGARDNSNIVFRDMVSGGSEKTHHDWQQAESEARYWIEKLCPPDGLVCDPFLGGGTTAAAAKNLNRNWIGFEIDADTAAIARKRVEG